MPLSDPGVAGWLLIIVVVLAVAWVLVFSASRASAREVLGEICNIEAALTADGGTIRVRNTGALALADVVIDRYPAQTGVPDHLWTVGLLAPGAALTAQVPPAAPPMPDRVLVRWRVGAPSGPAFTVVRPLVREG